MPTTLHLVLKKKWFDMIASGEKKEEYRELTNFWHNRLMHWELRERNMAGPYRHYTEFKHFDTVTFQHGYAANAPRVTVECLGITKGTGKKEWGGEGETFIIKLGNIISKTHDTTNHNPRCIR